MKVLIFSLVLCFEIFTPAVAQNTVRDTLSGTSSKHKILIIIDTITTMGNDEFIFNPFKIATIDLIKPDSSVLLYGERAKYGAMVIKPKGAIKFLRLGAILDKFKIKKEDRNLRVCINSCIAEESSNILADADEVIRVEITTKRNWRYYDNSINEKEKFINIITREGKKNGL